MSTPQELPGQAGSEPHGAPDQKARAYRALQTLARDSKARAVSPGRDAAAIAPALDLAAIRARLAGRRGREYWRSLDEIIETPATRQWLDREFPPGASEWPEGLDRRSFLKLMAASFALAGLNGCTKPIMTEIVPYVEQPERMVLGQPLYFATAMPLGGFGTGILVKSREGRPIKADGNPRHPASLGGSSIWIQASLLDLYNPDRAQTVTHQGRPSSWGLFLGGMQEALREQEKKKGSGLRILTGTVTSPTLGAQLRQLLEKFPEVRWHQYEPVNRDNALAGAQRAFGEYVTPHYHFEQADVILALDSDFLYTHPDRLRYARHFSDRRRVVVRGPEMNRLYAAESTPTLTGSVADHRLPLSARELEAVAWRVAQALGLPVPKSGPALDKAGELWIAQATCDLRQHQGKSLVTVGQFQPAWLHEWEHRVNAALGNVGSTVECRAPAEFEPVLQVPSLAELLEDMRKARVEFLLILGGNPAFDAPADFEFGEALKQVKHAVHVSLSHNETSALCEWHIPQTHFLESWGDIRSFDGTVSIQQPLIAPLFGGHSEHEVLGVMQRLQPQPRAYEIVRQHWRDRNPWEDFETGWRQALQDGLVKGTQAERKTVHLRAAQPLELGSPAGSQTVKTVGETPGGEVTGLKPGANERGAGQDIEPPPRELGSPEPAKPAGAEPVLEVLFRPDPNIWDGSFADNPWLQEVPKAISMLTWDNAVMVSPRLAQRRKLSNGDIVEVTLGDRWIQGPVWILPGQAANTVTLHLGYGRRRAGFAGTGAGFDPYYLRLSTGLWHATALELKKVAGRYPLATPQIHHRLHSPERQIYREGTLDQFKGNRTFVKEDLEVPGKEDTLYFPHQFDYPVKWGMSIDLTTCIGCNACTMACNIENNIPVVGKQQVSMGRDMLWIRVDTYYRGELDNPEIKYQPVPCMHCENAPCEYVCPVEATVHDHEGLNLQVYNRCIGTRYCSNNCPYKVRRFNFLGYTTHTTPLEALRNNPEVSVRSRGVMEKCSYCLQRIAAARIKASEENRSIREGEVRTACQEACPTQAIVFGIMTKPESQVAQYKRHALDYPMLGQENTRPRTTYLAKLQNPNPDLPAPPRGAADEQED